MTGTDCDCRTGGVVAGTWRPLGHVVWEGWFRLICSLYRRRRFLVVQDTLLQCWTCVSYFKVAIDSDGQGAFEQGTACDRVLGGGLDLIVVLTASRVKVPRLHGGWRHRLGRVLRCHDCMAVASLERWLLRGRHSWAGCCSLWVGTAIEPPFPPQQ